MAEDLLPLVVKLPLEERQRLARLTMMVGVESHELNGEIDAVADAVLSM